MPESPLHSMTGYGSADGRIGGSSIAVVVRCVNHRHLDIRLHLPEFLRPNEDTYATQVREALGRGRVEVGVTVADDEGARRVEVDRDLVASVAQEFTRLEEEGLISSSGLAARDLLAWPPAMRVQEADRDAEAIGEEVGEVLGQALANVVEARRHEGARLAQFLDEKLGRAEVLAGLLAERRQQVEDNLRLYYRQKLEDLSVDPLLSEERIALEVGAAIDKSSISEEIERLTAHFGQFRSVMTESGPVGRKLDFIVQEIFREFNTVASKSRDSESVHDAIEGKTLCEDLREQLRNIE